MKFSEMKLQAMNAVKSYFNRNWRREDLMNSGRVNRHAHRRLKGVYLTFFNVMLSSTVGSYLHLFWEVGGLFTVLCSVASSLWLYFTPSWRVNQRVSLLMIAAFCFGASVGLLTKYLFEMHQNFVASFYAGSTIGIGIFSFGALITRERSDIYLGCLLYCCLLMFSNLFMNVFFILDSYTVQAMLKVTAVLILFMGYFVVYSQEILYDARCGYIDFVNRALTVFFNLPGIVLHAARLYLTFGAKIEKSGHKISSGVE
ncbi:bax inhibitor 1-like [Solanum dulcamara]|uniref:bax inhibitor 1-like n=1 Tax=Solanum dulcamara TaxID=45834 RepID=UPI0024862BCB|nr:bax inhibitor 1-like [Solanum dulcamara]